ncbi:MAG: hypothetical protein ACR5K4_01640 [Sodalis sp. (in: enterobacteria)]
MPMIAVLSVTHGVLLSPYIPLPRNYHPFSSMLTWEERCYMAIS